MTARGFTLLEMMLAVVLFSVATVASMETLHRAQAASSDGENTFLATLLASRCLDELRNVSYANLLTATCTMPASVTGFSYTLTVTTPYTNLRQAAVTVSWTTPGGTSSVSLQTYRSGV